MDHPPKYFYLHNSDIIAANTKLTDKSRQSIYISRAENTINAYESDWNDFYDWCAHHHGQYLALDPCDILGAFGDYLGLEGRFAVPWDADGDLADRSLDGFLRIAIPTVGGFLLAMIIGAIPEMVIYLALQHSFEDRTEHVLQRYLHDITTFQFQLPI